MTEGNNRALNRLTRLLETESANHPLMADAIEARGALISDLDWKDRSQVVRAADRLADGIEDWVGYHGEALQHYMQEPWLSRWRKTCFWALEKVHVETMSSIPTA